MEWAAQQAGIEEGEWEPHFLRGQPDPLAAFLTGIAGGSAEAPQEMVAVSSQFAMQEQDALARLSANFDRLFSAQGAQSVCLQCLALGATQAQPARLQRGDADWLQLLAGRFRAY